MHQVQLGSTGDLNNYPQLIAKDLRLPKIQSGIFTNFKQFEVVAWSCKALNTMVLEDSRAGRD